MQFLRFIRNHHQHTLQVDDFRMNILGTKRISHAKYCHFVEDKFPGLLAFLTWVYVGACDEEDEIIKMLGSRGEDNLDFTNKDDLIGFLQTLVDFFFGEGLIGSEEIERVVTEVIEFDSIGNFSGVNLRDPNPKNN